MKSSSRNSPAVLPSTKASSSAATASPGSGRPRLLWQRLDDRQRRAGLALAAFPGLIYLLAILVAAAAPNREPAAQAVAAYLLREGRDWRAVDSGEGL
jgi:hypothetical protein